MSEKQHWVTSLIFVEAKQRGVSLSYLSEQCADRGQPIPYGTIKWWASGHGNPKIDQADLLLEILNMEIDIHQID